MGSNPMRSIASVAFFWLEGPSKKKEILAELGMVNGTLNSNVKKADDCKDYIMNHCGS